MKLRSFIITIFSFLFATFILLYQYFNKLIFILSKHLNVLYYTRMHISKIYKRLEAQGNWAFCQYIQIIANSSISLMSAYSILHFHQNFLHLLVIISHHVHHWFLQFIADIPDYSDLLQSSYYFKVIVCYFYLIFGYLGISSQIILTVDLIYVSNLPTIIIYKLLAKMYRLLIKYFQILYDLISIDQKYWLSCPYPPIFLRKSMKVIYIGLMPIITYLILLVIFYYLWLTFVIAVLKICMNISLNLGIVFDQLGFVLCLIKGIQLEEKSKNMDNQQIRGFTYKINKLKKKIMELQWIPLFEYSMFIQIFKGNDLFEQREEIPTLQRHTKLIKIINNFKLVRH